MSDIALPGGCLDAYLAHVVDGVTLGTLADREGGHRSTQSRRIARVEAIAEHPEWHAILDRLTAHRRDQTRTTGAKVTRDTVAAAFGMDLPAIHAAFAPAARALARRGATLMVADLPKAAIASPDGLTCAIDRDLALIALAFGWVIPEGCIDGTARKFVAALPLVECFALAETPADEASTAKPAAPRRKTRRDRRYTPPLTPVDGLLTRPGQTFLTPAHGRLAYEFHEIYALRGSVMATAFQEISAAIAPRLMAVLIEICGHHTGFEATEKKLGLPARSAKAIIALALDTYALARKPA